MYNYGKIVKLLFWREAKEWDWLVIVVDRQVLDADACEVSEIDQCVRQASCSMPYLWLVSLVRQMGFWSTVDVHHASRATFTQTATRSGVTVLAL